MFERQEFKKQAKAQLRGHWSVPVLIHFLVLAIILLSTVPRIVHGYSPVQSFILLISFVISGIFVIVLAKYYLIFTENPDGARFAVFLESFNLWRRGIVAYLWYFLWTFLWMLLFYVPGLIKAYAYSQIYFIVAENPQISVRKAMRLSIAMTKGYKGDLFVLDLSFVGWLLLCTLTFGIGYLWLIPYICATKANTYRFLKQSAFDRGVLKAEDFGMPAIAKDA